MEYNKRQYSRVPCEIESSFRDIEEGSSRPVDETVVQDISEGGIRFRANHFIPVHDRLLFRIHIPNQKTIEAVAQPAWIREIPSVGQYDIGARFVSLSESDRELVRAFTRSGRLTFPLA